MMECYNEKCKYVLVFLAKHEKLMKLWRIKTSLWNRICKKYWSGMNRELLMYIHNNISIWNGWKNDMLVFLTPPVSLSFALFLSQMGNHPYKFSFCTFLREEEKNNWIIFEGVNVNRVCHSTNFTWKLNRGLCSENETESRM